MSPRPDKKPRVDWLSIFMVAAMGVAVGCGWMLGKADPTEIEGYASPTSGAIVKHPKPPVSLASSPLRD